jgi:hypothetical protein
VTGLDRLGGPAAAAISEQLGLGPLGWHDAERAVLGADLPPGR